MAESSETDERTAAERTTLYAPDGRPYETSVPAEIVRLRAAGYSTTAPEQLTVTTADGGAELFDPATHNVDEVQAFLREHPELAEQVIAAEKAGKNRTSITGA